MKVKVIQSGLNLCDSMDYTIHGILQATFPFSKGSSQPRDRIQVSNIAGGFFFFFFNYYYYFFYFTILYWICHTSTCIRHGCTCVPHPEYPPTSLPIPSLWVIPVTSPKLPASCIEPGLVICFLYDIIHVLMLVSQIIPPHRVQKTVLYICVSFAVSHTGYHYHHSKFHIYVLVYCIGVFLSGLLHCV